MKKNTVLEVQEIPGETIIETIAVILLNTLSQSPNSYVSYAELIQRLKFECPIFNRSEIRQALDYLVLVGKIYYQPTWTDIFIILKESQEDNKIITTTKEKQPISKQSDSIENVIALPEPDYFGDCPTCYKNDGSYNLHKEHWYVCHQHKVRWIVGANLFSSWKSETPEDWDKNWRLIGHYKEIESLHRWKPNPDFSSEVTEDDIPF